MSDQVVMTDDQYLEDSQAIKTRIINKMVQNDVPTTEEGVELLLKVLDSRDKVALGRKKIDVEANIGSSAQAATQFIADFMRNYDPNSTPYIVDVPVERTIRDIPSSVPTPVLVTDETSTNPAQLSWKEFVSADEVGAEAKEDK